MRLRPSARLESMSAGARIRRALRMNFPGNGTDTRVQHGSLATEGSGASSNTANALPVSGAAHQRRTDGGERGLNLDVKPDPVGPSADCVTAGETAHLQHGEFTDLLTDPSFDQRATPLPQQEDSAE